MIDSGQLGEWVGSATTWGTVAGFVLRLIKLISGKG